jgi:hypothetical protein
MLSNSKGIADSQATRITPAAPSWDQQSIAMPTLNPTLSLV